MSNLTKEDIKKVIIQKYSNKRFTCGDIIYAIYPKCTQSILGTIRNNLVKLTKEGFLKYTIELRGVPHLDSEFKRRGAVFSINKKNSESK